SSQTALSPVRRMPSRGTMADMTQEHVPEHIGVYLRFRSLFGDPNARRAKLGRKAAKPATTVPFGEGRDPHSLGDVIDSLTQGMGWRSPLARGDLLAHWPELVGEETAAHAVPVGIQDGVLAVRCDSTAWATQLRLMRAKVTTEIARRFPDAGIESV